MATIDDINRNSGVSMTSDGVAKATSGAEGLGRDDFMKLLVAQLRNQDPDNPVDTKELVTQLSQLTSVEQLISMNDRLESLEKATNTSSANQSAGLIGKTVSAEQNKINLSATGVSATAVNLQRDAAKATVSVSNAAGRVVRTFDLTNTKAGQQKIEWDGRGDDGIRAAEGTYTVNVTATDANDQPVDASMSVSGLVTGVSYENGYPELVLGTIRVPLSGVTSIGQ